MAATSSIRCLLAAGLALRILLILISPADLSSIDMQSWIRVIDELAHGRNPYVTTTHLNWGPVWPMLLYLAGQASERLGLAIPTVIRIFLALLELLLARAVCHYVLTFAEPVRRAGLERRLLWGYVLNPIGIFLVCLHGNFDVLVALLVMGALYSLSVFVSSGDRRFYLMGALSIGLAAVTKTFPVALAGLLSCGQRRYRIAAVLLVLGPVALAIGPLYLLAPRAITENVLLYRSYSGFFGVSGLLALFGAGRYMSVTSLLFYAGLFALVALVWRRTGAASASGYLAPVDLVRSAALIFVTIIAFGPGYGPQYGFWLMAPLFVLDIMGRDEERRAIRGFYLVAALTYIFEYSFLQSHGGFLHRVAPLAELAGRVDSEWSTPGMQTVLRLPLFYGYLVLFRVLLGGVAPGLKRGDRDLVRSA